MVGTWTYDAASNVLTVVGGSSGSPAGFVDAWNADTAGTRTLKAATASPFTASLETAVKPADSLALQLSVVITNFSVAGSVTLTGKDAWGNSISEILNVTANGTVVSTLYYASIDANGVVAAGTFTAAVTQPRWGIVWKQGNAQFAFDCKILIGDGTTSTYFADYSKDVTFNANIGANAYVLSTTANATATFGTLISTTYKAVGRGVTFFLDGGSNYWFNFAQNSTVYFYSGSITGLQTNMFVTGYIARFWGVSLGNFIILTGIYNCDFYNVSLYSSGGYQAFYNMGSGNTYDAISAFAAYLNRGVFYGSISGTFRNVRSVNYYLVQYNNPPGAPTYLINCIPDAWKFSWSTYSVNKVVYRQYEFDLTTDPGATVTLKDNTGATVFSVTADAVTGAIATQTVSRGYYDQPHGDTLQDYGPFTLTITKAGKMPYTQAGIILSEKTRLLIALRDQLTGTATAANVAAGATFYKDDADTKLAGSLVNPVVFLDVASGKPVLNLNSKNLGNQLVLGL